MIGALKALQQTVQVHDARAEQPAFQTMKISNEQGLLRFFATHPPLQERIKRLEQEG